MADSPDGTDSVAESVDDNQLTIRIPNPKHYMARQSQWKGRRGKPRCDHCRLNNLKGAAHLQSLRLGQRQGLQVYSIAYASASGNSAMRPLSPEEPQDIPAGAQASPTAADRGMIAGPSGSHVFESELRTEPQIRQYMPPNTPPVRDGSTPMNEDGDSGYQQGPDGQFTLGMIVTTPHIDPWTHGSFAPLPDAIIHALRTVNAIEMPSRHQFDEALGRFVAGLSAELRETATFTVESYSEVARAVSEGTVADLPPKLKMWATCHHARAGSRKSYLILLPRDAFYNMNPADEEKLRANFIVQTDGEPNGESDRSPEGGNHSLESVAVFERVPVQTQIYDILVFTHRNHGVAPTMLFEARRIGVATITWPMVEMFIRLCPLCKMRAKGGVRHSMADEDIVAYRPIAPTPSR
ncbi:hypothetical protein EUX98_g3257 [Antrodiella citrinella]|uniref:Uncharacterized protein n=1 Tax=Antrodiella citrinella TaxID=2447956 RepID=A0A4S4MX03_9APHY|nr:hypothetical protein EUX98_g3257 [Antrodiella citrinella]